MPLDALPGASATADRARYSGRALRCGATSHAATSCSSGGIGALRRLGARRLRRAPCSTARPHRAGAARPQTASTGALAGAGVAHGRRPLPAPAGSPRASRPASGDWDLAVFDAAGRPGGRLGLSSAPTRSPRASSAAGSASRCRPAGAPARARTARLVVESERLEAPKPEKLSLVRVSIAQRGPQAHRAHRAGPRPDRARRRRLRGGRAPRRRRRASAARGQVHLHDRESRDLVARGRATALPTRRLARGARPGLPSGRDGELPAAGRLQQRDEGARGREPGRSSSRSPCRSRRSPAARWRGSRSPRT